MILHYLISPYETSDGVRKKIDQQIKVLQFHRIQVERVLIPTISVPTFDSSIKKIIGIPFFLIFHIYNDLFQNIFLINYFRTLPSDHAIYVRMPVPSLMTWVFFRKNKHRVIIVEHQSRELREYLMKGNLLYPIVDWIFGGAIRSMISIQISVTTDVMQYQKKRNPKRDSTQFLVISNGIDTEFSPIRIMLPPLDTRVEMIFLGDVKYWHGIDRIISGLEHYSGNYLISFTIFGHNSQYKTQLYNFNNPKVEVKLHPFVSGKELDHIFETAHIAISSLGIHRIGIKEISPLKSREYCSRGIPFIFSATDPDFSPTFSFALEFPADDNPIHIDQVLHFLEDVYHDGNFSQKMHEFAVKNLDWSSKLKPLIHTLNVKD